MKESPTKLYQHKVKDIDGRTQDFEQFKCKVLLIVNIASNCGLAKKNYINLAEILHLYQHKGFKVLLFPCNGYFQERNGLKEIKNLVSQYSDDFMIFEKIEVYGTKKHPIFEYLCSNFNNGWYGSWVKWNFTKFLVDRKGNVVNRYGPADTIQEDDECLKKALEDTEN